LVLHHKDDEVLRQKAQPVSEITEEVRQLASDMLETMYAHSGVGLAAGRTRLTVARAEGTSMPRRRHNAAAATVDKSFAWTDA